MRSSVVRPPRRIVRVIGPMSAVFLAGVTTAQAQAVPRQPPPPNSPAPASQPPLPARRPRTTGQPAPTGGARLKPVTDVTPIEALRSSPSAPTASASKSAPTHAASRFEIQLSAASADRLAGFAQEQAGVFDTAITGGIEYSYRVQELTESRKEDERNKRRKLDDFINQAGPDVGTTRSTVNLLQQILSLPPGSERAGRSADRRQPEARHAGRRC